MNPSASDWAEDFLRNVSSASSEDDAKWAITPELHTALTFYGGMFLVMLRGAMADGATPVEAMQIVAGVWLAERKG